MSNYYLILHPKQNSEKSHNAEKKTESGTLWAFSTSILHPKKIEGELLGEFFPET